MPEYLLYQILELATAIFETFIVQQYICVFFVRLVKVQHAFLGYLLFYFGLAILSMFYRQPIILASYSIIGVFLLSLFNYSGNVTSKSFSALFFGVLMIGSEIICASLLSIFGSINLEEDIEYGLHRALFIVTAKITQILIVRLLGLFVKWKSRNSDEIDTKTAFILMICQIFSIILSYNIFMSVYNAQGDLTVSVMCSILGIMYTNIILFWFFDRVKVIYQYKQDKEIAEVKLEYQRQYYELLEEHQQETDALWHDMKKHLSSIKELYEMDLKLNATQYIDIFENKINAIPKIIRTSVPVINAILVDELRMAKKENIEVMLNINISKDLKINDFDLCVLLGNTVENSIEACMLLQAEVKRFIYISILQEDSLLLISVKNPYNSTHNTLLQKTGKHGYGLRNVNKVVKKYGGNIEIKNLDNIFDVSIIIP